MEHKPLLIPIAIIVAGLLIASAIYFRSPAGAQPAAKRFDPTIVPKLAQKAGIKSTDFASCLESNRYAAKVEEETAEAIALGGQGTPFPIIVTREGKTIPLPGAVPFESLTPLLDDLLAGTATTSVFQELPIALRPVTASDHLNGPLDAPLIIIEYSDLDCPYCQRFHDTMNQVKKEYGDQVTWVYRHWPILSNHPNAGELAEATECVAELGGQKAFWQFVDAIFAAH